MARGSVPAPLALGPPLSDQGQEQLSFKSIQTPHRQNAPSIRLIHATPHSTDPLTDGSLNSDIGFPNISINADNSIANSSWAAVPFDVPQAPPSTSVLAPKEERNGSKKRLVLKQKKSKLSLLVPSSKSSNSQVPPTSLRGSSSRADFSDVARRIGITSGSASGFDIYVDHSSPNDDVNAGEVVMVKKKKSRAGLNGFQWGAMGEVTNIPAVPKEDSKLKDSGKETKEGSGRWWAIGRGRKDSRDTERNENIRPRSKSPGPVEQFKKITSKRDRSRFNSFDSGLLLNSSSTQHSAAADAPPAMQRSTSVSNVLQIISTSGAADPDMLDPSSSPFVAGSDIPKDPIPSRSLTPTFVRDICSIDTVGARPSEPGPSSAPPVENGCLAPPTEDGFLAPPISGSHPRNAAQSSIAQRAMRSVRSLARIGSWAQMRNTATINHDDDVPSLDDIKPTAHKNKKDMETTTKKTASKKRAALSSNAFSTVRSSSGSSFEAGYLSPSPTKEPMIRTSTLGRRKASVLGLGLPSTVRNPSSLRVSSATPSVPNQVSKMGTFTTNTGPPTSFNASRLPGDFNSSCHHEVPTRDRPPSMGSTTSSLRPSSITSRTSSNGGSSTASVRWDEEKLRTVKENRKRERAEKKERDRAEGKTESKHTGGSKRHTPLSEIFPLDVQAAVERSVADILNPHREISDDDEDVSQTMALPKLTLERATNDGHEAVDDSPAIDSEDDAGREDLTDIPSTRGSLPRLRSKSTSAQLAPRSRPKAIHDEGSVLSMLDQATNELAHLLNHLDLEATPSPARTSLSDSSSTEKRVALIAQAGESPVNKVPKEPMPALGARASSASITSLRPYAQSRGAFTKGMTTPTVQPSELYGQPIAPWKVLNRSFSPPRPKVSEDASAQTVRHSPLVTKRAQSPPRAPEPPLVFQPLGPANKKQLRITKTPGMPNESLPPTPLTIVPSPVPLQNGDDDRSPSTNTFGSAPSSPVLPLGQSPVFKRKGHARQRSSLGQYELIPMAMEEKRNSIPIEPEGRKILGLSGTMGASTTPESTNLDLDDPDSDIPYELQAIIAASSDDDAGSINSSTTASTETQPDQQEANIPNASSSSSEADLAFHAHLNDDSASLDIDGEGSVRGEEDTTKSFDFTGELAKLNESGARDRRSFVEQLENAFRTPAKINLRYDFGLSKTSLLEMEIPPVPRLPSIYAAEASMSMDSENLPFMKATADCEFIRPDPEVPQDISCVDASLDGLSSAVKAVDVSIPFIQTDALITRDGHQVQDDESLAVSRLTCSVSSRPSDGRLDFNFKFGGSTSSHNDAPSAPLTLSDIIPPPPEAHRLSNISVVEEDGSVLKSVKAQAMELPVHLDLPLPPSSRPRIDSDTSYKGSMEESVCKPVTSDHSRRESTLSFLGFESFDEVRRGFEFNGDRPGFYPMALAEYGQSRSQLGHNKHDSGFSIPSVSSYGAVLRPGLPDPFEYGTTDMQSHRISDDMSMSIDDTFDFVKRNQRRTRVDSDTSSFYFRPLSMNMGRHRNRDSVASVSSMTGPPVSIYNRSFGAYSQRRNSAYLSHRREDSDASASSVALSYAMHGAVGGRRPVLSRHLQGMSTDSMFSDFSPAQATRPGLGDKMFQSLDHGMPLTSISASPNSLASKHVGDYTTYEERSPTDYCDSLMDDLPPFSFGPLFERARHRTSTSSESIFGTEEAKASAPIPNALAPPFQFRPLSMTSFSDEDYNEFILNADEGDDTLITMFDGDHVRRQSMGSVINASPCIRMEKRKPSTAPHQAAPINNVSTIPPTIKSRVIEEKPLIASASPSHSGGEHMTKARHSLLEQQSLEGCVPIPSKDLLPSARQAVFTRPATTGRSRSSTVTSNSSDADTPPLSISGDSLSGGSQSSIDLSSIDLALSHLSHSDELSALGRVRARARGQGHRRRISQARMSRASVYETIEELPELIEPSSPDHHMSLKEETIQVDPNNSVFVVDPDTATDSVMIDSAKLHTNMLHKYYALKDEAVETVTESRVVWPDTQFSAYAMQSFVPPEHPAGMQAMLEHSVKTYGPLPLELRPHRTRKRTLSRPSPYPSTKIHASPDESRVLILETSRPSAVIKRALTEVSLNPNVSTEPGPSINIKPLSSFKDTSEKPQVPDFQSHPRVVPSSNRSALGWVKRNTSKTNVGVDKKENNSLGTSMVLTSGESLRINRPRPRGRPMPTTSRPIRI